MDDLEHSVVIAERDWESFYEESEECSIQTAWLASLDDSGFSDTDDEKKSSRGHDLAAHIEADNQTKDKEPNAATLTKTKRGTALEEPECLNDNKNNDRFTKQTAEINLNDVSATHAYWSTDISERVNDVILTNQQHTELNSEDFREHNETQSDDDDKLCEAAGETNTSFSCMQDGGHVGSIDGKTALKVSESLAAPKKEKERWFVTVNDSPVIQRVKSGQKKGRKKKTSRKLVRHSLVAERQCSVSNNNKGEEREVIKDEQILQNEFMQPSQTYTEDIYFNPRPNYVCEEFLIASCNNQELGLSPIKEPEKATIKNTSVPEMNWTLEASSFNTEEENTSCVFSVQSKDNSDAPTETLTNNPASLNSRSPTSLTDNPQLQPSNGQSMCLTTLDDLMSINSSHKAYKDTQPNGFRFILEETNTSSGNLQNQEYPKEMAQELKQSSQDQGAQIKSLEAAVGENCPVYALSSFWDEMEKLTINDILHLRSVHNRSPMSRSVISDESGDVYLDDKEPLTSKHDSAQDSGLMDDSGDSDYFTHVDESKPDRSSCELSALSDCDDEFLQILNRNQHPCCEPQHDKEPTKSSRSTFIPGHEFDSNIETETQDIIKLSDQDGILQYLYPAILSFGNTAVNQSISISSEILAKDITRLGSTDASFPFTRNLSVCEMYDDFSSDFEIGTFLFPSTRNKIVPIYNASRSVLRDLVFPHKAELDFDPDYEQEYIPIRDLTHFSSQPEMSTSPSGMPNLCFYTSQRENWSSLLSLRRIRFIGKGSTWHYKIGSCIFSKETRNEASYVSKAQQPAPVTEVGNKSFLQLAESQQHAVLIPKKDNFIFSIKQADMCLACIAFASWVLKSSNSESTDTWKSALLANISAISAIEYLRKYGNRHS